MGNDFAVHAALTDATCDEHAVLRAEVYDNDSFALNAGMGSDCGCGLLRHMLRTEVNINVQPFDKLRARIDRIYLKNLPPMLYLFNLKLEHLCTIYR